MAGLIELLGIGIPRADRAGWLVREVTARLQPGELVVVGAADSAARLALLDVVAGRRIPSEGRAWIHHVPLMRETAGRIRRLGCELRLGGEPGSRGSRLWAVLASSSGARLLGGLPALPGRRARARATAALSAVGLAGRAHETVASLSRPERSRLIIAQALVRGPRHLAVRELDRSVPPHDVAPLLRLLRSLARDERCLVIVTLADPTRVPFADRYLHVADARLVDGPPPAPGHPRERRPELVRT